MKKTNRRAFLKASGSAYLLAAVGCDAGPQESGKPPLLPKATDKELANLGHAPSKRYVLVDTGKCQGCLTCMLSCSLAHEGCQSLSLSRIQVRQNSFDKYPGDLDIDQCRQCLEPTCVDACPTGALHVDKQNGNVRTVDQERCEGCMSCVEACSQEPGRMLWDFEKQRALKCDLCADTPHWKEKGGASGRQICAEMCPLGAIAVVDHIPLQNGDSGYEVNLRGLAWKKQGYAID